MHSICFMHKSRLYKLNYESHIHIGLTIYTFMWPSRGLKFPIKICSDILFENGTVRLRQLTAFCGASAMGNGAQVTLGEIY